MYSLNPLKRNVLITKDEVIFHAPTQNTVDPRMIEQSIIVAEERFIRPALGYEYYQQLLTTKNKLITDANKATLQTEINASMPEGSQDVVLVKNDIVNASEYLSADNLVLWYEHLWKLTAEAVMLLALPEGFVQFGSEGTIHKQAPAGPMSTGGIVTPDLRSMKWMLDKKLMDRIDPLIESLHEWFCLQRKNDRTKYTLYTKPCPCDQDNDGIGFKRKSQFILGLYDDDPDPCNCS